MSNDSTIFKELQSGTKLAGGKYVIERVLGTGGFGITYYAHHATLNQYFAIKEFFINGFCMRHTQNVTIHLQGMQEDLYAKYRQKFVEEAQTLAKLDHPGIVRVTDVFDENETSYIVMPFIHGVTLYDLIKKKGKLPYEMAVNYMAQVCEALDYCHKRNILHRDVKPENIMITPENKAILIDFGSAREFVQDHTQTYTTILTRGYAPPEQYSSTSRKGTYSDIYSVGAVFYFIVTGNIPMDATERLIGDFVEPQNLTPELSDVANQTILKAMAIKPENRYQNVNEFMCELTGNKDWKSSSGMDIIVKKGISKKWIAGIIIAVLLLFAGGGVWFYNQHKEEHNRLIYEMLNGQDTELRVCMYDKMIYIRPAQGELDTTVWYSIDDNLQVKTLANLPLDTPVCSYTYTGQMKDGYPNGKGFARYDDKATYTGMFNKGLKQGNDGKYVYPDGITTYIGPYKNDLRSGKGKLIKSDGTTFEGIWREDKINGVGRILDANGNEIESGVYQE